MKEVFGWLTIFSLCGLLAFLIKESIFRPRYAIHPCYWMIRRYVKHELRMRQKYREERKNAS
ncbi:MAG: hypothetical protein LUD02_03645 [Tannerellaceae bacterium]|nr:hypothetical protein [Tannerellaceae bacterium]MCD8263353.1 hypothetical protein [Tannerellaceae bacterium]